MYYKVLNHKHKHNGFQYRLGLNVDNVPFKPVGSCEPGGLYYTTKEYIGVFFGYGVDIAEITIPEDACTYADPEGNKWKADKIFIHKITPYQDMEWWDNQEDCLTLIKQNGLALQFVKTQTQELCFTAVKNTWYALQYVKEQTHDMCLEALRQSGLALRFVNDQTLELCLEAIKNDIISLQHVRDQTDEICLAAVRQDGLALSYVKNQTEKICLEAVHQNGLALQIVKDQTREICLEAMKQNQLAVEQIRPLFKPFYSIWMIQSLQKCGTL